MIDIRKRIKKNGKPSYNVCIRLKGHQTVSKTFERLTDAREWAAKTTRDIKNNLNFPERKAKKYTIAEIIDRFIENKFDWINNILIKSLNIKRFQLLPILFNCRRNMIYKILFRYKIKTPLHYTSS